MKILIIGSGGREHALAWSLSRDPTTTKIYAAPGNPGIAEIATCVPIQATDLKELASFALREKIDLTLVGPEAPLAAGITDIFREHHLTIFGPSRASAQLESSKSFAKNLCSEYGIPTPHWETFAEESKAKQALNHVGPPWVIKADGLAAGKGTTVTSDRQEAETAIHSELARDPGRIVLEEFIDGWEASFTATVSGDRAQWLAPVFQDYKPAYDNDAGPNTGGMGVYTPLPQVTPQLVERVKKKILDPSVRAMIEQETPFQGVLYLNIIVKHGTQDPLLLEYNARFGDPEAQGIVPLIKGGLLAHLKAVADDSSKTPQPEMSASSSVAVVLASRGYPVQPTKGDNIRIGKIPGPKVTLFHAGTARRPTGELVTAGGRVLNIVATGPDVESARRDAYSVIGNAVSFDGMQYRRDIGSRTIRHRRLDPIKT